MAQLDDLYLTSTYLIPWVCFLIALGGSAHCIGMCGGLAMAVSNDKQSKVNYQLGRLISYTALGFLFGFMGSTVKELFQSTTVTLISTTFIGLILIWWGVRLLLTNQLKIHSPNFLGQFGKFLMGKTLGFTSPGLKSVLVGLISIFLPCGFLYGVAIIIASFQSPILGAASMFGFWAGTVPALLFAPSIIHKILTPLKNKAPTISSLALISLGLITISFRYYQFYSMGSCH